jgi:[protein-PII] uridylyltransferase
MSAHPATIAAHARAERLDALVHDLTRALAGAWAAIALGAYGRQELTARGEADLLFLRPGGLSASEITQRVGYPLWERAIRVETFVRSPDEAVSDIQRSWPAATRFLDARFVAGDANLYASFGQKLQPLRRDRERLRRQLRSDAQQRHASHPSVSASLGPDLFSGRGGLADLNALRWLGGGEDPRTIDALEFLLATLDHVEELHDQSPRQLSPSIVEQLDPSGRFLPRLYAHARWIAFSLDSALTQPAVDRRLGPYVSIRRGELVAERPPPLHRAPGFGLRLANVVGLAAPSADLLLWAGSSSAAVKWDAGALEQFWRLLRAADWRAWDFLDVTGLLVHYLPEVQAIWRRPGGSRSGDLAVDYHSFLALRSLHAWSESGVALSRRIWSAIRHRDAVYLAVLLHELTPEAAVSVARRIGLADAESAMLGTVAGSYQLVLDTATRRDLHDEDLVLELATRLGSREHLSAVFLVAVAHEIACGEAAWSPWKADVLRQLFGQLETALRQPTEIGVRRTRSLERHREHIARELERRGLARLVPLVTRLPRRYVLSRTPVFVARHLAMLDRQPLLDGEVRIQALRRRQADLWDVLVVARDRPGLLATVAGVLALRGVSVLAADAATSADGLVLDVFTVTGAQALQWSFVEADLKSVSQGRIPLHDLLGSRPAAAEKAAAVQVTVDNSASQFFSVVEVRAPDQVGLLYRIASALRDQGLDIHHARITTNPDGVLDVFYVRDLSGQKLSESAAQAVAAALMARLTVP